jgi:hypothetical protein
VLERDLGGARIARARRVARGGFRGRFAQIRGGCRDRDGIAAFAEVAALAAVAGLRRAGVCLAVRGAASVVSGVRAGVWFLGAGAVYTELLIFSRDYIFFFFKYYTIWV